MKPIHIKRVIDFIHRYHPEHTRTELNVLLEAEPEQFVYLLNEAIERSGSTPKCAIKFIKEIQKIIQETSTNKENPTMENEIKPSFTMRLVAAAKNVWGKVTHFFSTNAKKTALTGSAIVIAVVAFFATNNTALLNLLATIKSRGVINSLKTQLGKVTSLIVAGKNLVMNNIGLAWMFVQLAAEVALNKVIALKNFLVARVKQGWEWVMSLFKPELEEEHQYKAA
jgi:hypothetical protein